MKCRVALVSNSDYTIHQYRLPLIRELVRRGAEVYAVAEEGPFVSRIEQAGARFLPWRVDRQSLNPLKDARSFLSLLRIYRELRPAVAHHFTIKPIIYGSVAARLAGVPVTVATLTGLGYVFLEESFKARLLRNLVHRMYRVAFRCSGEVMFHNPHDLSEFRKAGLLPGDKGLCHPGGSGVDTAFFSPGTVDGEAVLRLKDSLSLPRENPVIVLAARMLWHKGVAEYVECARIVKKRRGDAQFLLVGPVDHGNPAAIPEERIAGWQAEGFIRYLGERENIREILALSDIVVLPSYREGMPRVLLEAASMGKAFVTTDVPGCRDAADYGRIGLLVPAKDSAALAGAVEELLRDPARRDTLGRAALEKAVREYDERKVAAQALELYQELLERKGLARIG